MSARARTGTAAATSPGDLVEALPFDDEAMTLVRAGRMDELRARRRRTLREAALYLAREGVVSIEAALQGTPA